MTRLGIGARAAIDDTATGSVGDRIAASANATASGITGIIQWISRPAPITVNTTSPNASCRISPRSRNRPLLGMRQPSRNSSGGRNNTKNRCGSRVTPWPNTPAIVAPSAICTSGRGSGSQRGSTRVR
ncbi:hypothetical protein J2X52_002272 [Luteimonas sp. 3794]|nr:hypothetical protein [Luteimonas sp. 3794]